MDRTRSFYSGHKWEIKASVSSKKTGWITFSISFSEIDCVAVDGSGELHVLLLQKTEQIKTSADSVNAVWLWVDNKFFSTCIIAFNTGNVPKICETYSRSNPQHYNIILSTKILPQSMSQLLVYKKTKTPGRASIGSIERSFITQRFPICSCRKCYHLRFYMRWENQQSRRCRHIINTWHTWWQTCLGLC